MPIDPEVSAEISSIKNKLMKLEADLSGMGGAEWANAKKEIASLRADLTKIVKPDSPPKPDKAPAAETSDDDPLVKLFDGDD
jgi:hypothetical protein